MNIIAFTLIAVIVFYGSVTNHHKLRGLNETHLLVLSSVVRTAPAAFGAEPSLSPTLKP